jgi:hypothetical protein
VISHFRQRETLCCTNAAAARALHVHHSASCYQRREEKSVGTNEFQVHRDLVTHAPAAALPVVKLASAPHSILQALQQLQQISCTQLASYVFSFVILSGTLPKATSQNMRFRGAARCDAIMRTFMECRPGQNNRALLPSSHYRVYTIER